MKFASILRAGYCILLGLGVSAQAQVPGDLSHISIFEKMIDDGEEQDLEALLEELEAWHRQPLCLQTADAEEIGALPFLTRSEAATIWSVLQSGPGSWEQLAVVLQSDEDRLNLLRYCAVLECEYSIIQDAALSFRSRFQQEDTPRKGFVEGTYQGSRARLQQRLRLGVGKHASAGVIVEKDPGEQLFADHVSGFLALSDIGVLQRVVVGDFAVTAGQGLVIWQAFARGKGSEATRIGKSAPLLTPSATATEGLASRGIAAVASQQEWKLLAMYSTRQRDASIDEETGTAGAFSIDGLHRTESERARKGSVHEQLAGVHLQWKNDLLGGRLVAGTSGVTGTYGTPSLSRTPFGFEGSAAWVAGCDAAFHSDGFHFFTEAALSHTHVPAVLAGLEAQLSPELNIALLYRRYHERFVSLQGAAFGERSGTPQNEEGLYCGLRFRPMRGLLINTSWDVFHIPNRTYFLHLPTSGIELQCGAEYRLDPGTQLHVRFKHERKDQTVAAVDEYGHDIRPLTMRTQSSFRVQLQRALPSGLRVRLRAEYAHSRYDMYVSPSRGTLLSAELRWRPAPWVSCTARLTAYESDSYDARLYQFEHDVRGVMQNVVCYGHGIRSYILVTLHLSDALELGARYALTVRDGDRSSGSGDDMILGDRIGVLSLQLDVEL